MIDVVEGRLNSPDQVLDLLRRAETADGSPPVSEQVVHRLRRGEVASFLSREQDAVVGYAAVEAGEDGCSAELVIDPAHRRRGLGRQLAETVLAFSAERPVSAWAHGSLPGSAELARRLGFVPVRELRRLAWEVPAETLPAVAVPDGITLRPFRPGKDDEGWLRLNAAAFASHPEQGRWTSADLAARLGEPRFDPAGFFLAERDGELIGFHWTKEHSPTLGEVYVLGVSPVAQGTGLGKVLLAAGLEWMQRRGHRQVLLYVDADNVSAVRMYERAGFHTAAVDVLYRRRG